MKKPSEFPARSAPLSTTDLIRKRSQSPAAIQPRNAKAPQKQPIAPAVYSPQQIPKILQRKTAQSTKTATVGKRLVASPAYRPQPVPKVLQTKRGNALPSRVEQTRPQTCAPPAYRPQTVTKVLQTKAAATPPYRQPQSHTNQRPSGAVLMKARTQANPSANHPIQRSAAVPKSSTPQVSRKHQVIQRVHDPFFNKDIPERWATFTPGLFELNSANEQKVKGGSYTLVGLHGTSIAHASSMLRGINPPGGGSNSGEHLGPGFYVTKKEQEALDFAEVVVFGPEPEMEDENQSFKSWQEASNTFKEHKKKYGGKSTIILFIFAHNFQQMSGAEFEKGKQLDQMETLMEQNDYFVNSRGTSSLDEIKFNKRAYNKLVAVIAPAK